MGAQLGAKGGFSDINMTPLIDIVLVVLIIMMVNIPIQIEEMGLKLPSPIPPPTPPPPDADQLVIAVYSDDTVALNRKAMGEKEMLYELGRRLRPMTAKNVFVDADTTVTYGRVVDMVDLARQAGAANVGLAKVKPDGPLPPTSVSSGAGIARGAHFQSPLVRGEITEKLAYEAMAPLEGQVQQIYLGRLSMRPDLTGSYSIYVEVGPQGELLKPPEVEADSVGDLDMRDQVTALVQNLRYKPLGAGKTAWVRYSVLFAPGGGQ